MKLELKNIHIDQKYLEIGEIYEDGHSLYRVTTIVRNYDNTFDYSMEFIRYSDFITNLESKLASNYKVLRKYLSKNEVINYLEISEGELK